MLARTGCGSLFCCASCGCFSSAGLACVCLTWCTARLLLPTASAIRGGEYRTKDGH